MKFIYCNECRESIDINNFKPHVEAHMDMLTLKKTIFEIQNMGRQNSRCRTFYCSPCDKHIDEPEFEAHAKNHFIQKKLNSKWRRFFVCI